MQKDFSEIVKDAFAIDRPETSDTVLLGEKSPATLAEERAKTSGPFARQNPNLGCFYVVCEKVIDPDIDSYVAFGAGYGVPIVAYSNYEDALAHAIAESFDYLLSEEDVGRHTEDFSELIGDYTEAAAALCEITNEPINDIVAEMTNDQNYVLTEGPVNVARPYTQDEKAQILRILRVQRFTVHVITLKGTK